ncbi:mitochondrial inner membrane m-AAA protease component AFG3L1-like isoform X2 [Kogia breviceps]
MTAAYREAGRAVVGWFLGAQPPARRRCGSGPTPLPGALCGHGAFQITTGAQDNLRKATQNAHAQIVQFGMSERLGQVSFALPRPGEALVEKPCSEAVAQLIDQEAWRLVSSRHALTLDLLTCCRERWTRWAGGCWRRRCWSGPTWWSCLGPDPSRRRPPTRSSWRARGAWRMARPFPRG